MKQLILYCYFKDTPVVKWDGYDHSLPGYVLFCYLLYTRHRHPFMHTLRLVSQGASTHILSHHCNCQVSYTGPPAYSPCPRVLNYYLSLVDLVGHLPWLLCKVLRVIDLINRRNLYLILFDCGCTQYDVLTWLCLCPIFDKVYIDWSDAAIRHSSRLLTIGCRLTSPEISVRWSHNPPSRSVQVQSHTTATLSANWMLSNLYTKRTQRDKCCLTYNARKAIDKLLEFLCIQSWKLFYMDG